MIGKARRPSKINHSGDSRLLVLFIAFAVVISAYLLADYSEVFFPGRYQKIVKVDSGLAPSLVSPVEVLRPADSVLGCDFRSSRDNVIYGGKVKFSWNCSAASKCSFDGKDYGPVNDGIEVVPENTRRYILECSSGDRSEAFAKSVGVFEFVIREISPSNSAPGIEEKTEISPPVGEKTSP